jgi:hypothetical protein
MTPCDVMTAEFAVWAVLLVVVLIWVRVTPRDVMLAEFAVWAALLVAILIWKGAK